MVEAGAGTGKTWVLARRFLHLLESHPDWPLESLVAVTFTEKAAREMRTRIRSEVEKAARQAGPASHWQDRRRELDRLQVSTIHSLCARILRASAIAAGLDPRFEVLDEHQAGLLKEDALRQALAELNSRAESEQWPVDGGPGSRGAAFELLSALRVRDLQEQLAILLDQRGTVQRLFANLPDPPALLEHWRSGLAQARQELWQAQLRASPALAHSLAALPLARSSDPADKLLPSVAQAQAGCRAVQAGDLASACACFLKVKRNAGQADHWGGKEALVELKEQLKFVHQAAKVIQDAGCAEDPGPWDEAAAQALQYWRDLWVHLDAVYARMKAARQALDFDDLELLAEDLLAREPRDPRLQTFLDAIRHLMVDEFQDTNATQQRIVYALAHPRQPGRLFVVGDAKQSIYRFRQAQVAVFNQTGQEIAGFTGQPAVRLNRSFRTHAALVKALNRLFSSVFQPLGETYAAYEAPPGPLEAHRPAPPLQTPAPAPVELWLLPAADPHGNALSAADVRVYEAQLLAQRLLQLQTAGFQVWDRDQAAYRPFRFDDSAILFRATTSLPLYEEQFKALGLPYLTVSGRGYYDRPEVQDLIALLTCLYNPADDLSLATVLRSPLFSLSDETLYHLRWNAAAQPAGSDPHLPASFYHSLQVPPVTAQPQQVAFAARVLAELCHLAGRVDAWRLLRTALDRTGYEATLALIDRDLGGSGRQRSNVHKLLELARQQGGGGLSQFLRNVLDLRAREARAGEALGSAPASGAVQLMSIHAAKGLEFPVVAVADLGRKSRRSDPPRLLYDPAFGMVCQLRDAAGSDWKKPPGYAWAEWLNRQMEAAESKRLLYVACTRAADLLLLSGRAGDDTGTWLQDLLAAWEIPPAGDPDHLLAKPDFTLRVLRPSYSPLDTAHPDLPVAVPPGPPMLLPALARPLPPDLPRAAELPPLRLAVAPAAGPPAAGRASAAQIDYLIHRLLADWSCLHLPPSALDRRLAAATRRAGLLQPGAAQAAQARLRRLLNNLRRSALYAHIEAAGERYTEVPYTLETSHGVEHGVIDLLYRTVQGSWHLVGWTAEWLPSRTPEAGDLAAYAQPHCRALARCAAAAARSLGVTPAVALCFLAAGAATYSFPQAELDGH